ncbi:MAG TPA: DNA modification methylase [Planctomycetota bacterium]|nr:DNA modification methylase [Planctomycetota bacterium]
MTEIKARNETVHATGEPAAIWVALDDLKPWDKNPRLNDQAVDRVAESIKRFGFGAPILARRADKEVIAGHTRLKAARKLGLDRVPVRFLDLDPADAHLLSLADNKLGEIAEWDDEGLAAVLRELQAEDMDLGDFEMAGFEGDALAELLAEEGGGGNPDAVPEAPDEAITKSGDLWILGDHRLLCGDSSKPADVDRLLGGAVIHLVNTDPPYNVKVEPRSNNAIAAGLSSFPPSSSAIEASDAQGMHHQGFDLARHKTKSKRTTKKLRAKDRPLANDFVSDEEFDRMLRAWFGNMARVLVDGGSFYIWGGYANCANYPPALKECELYFSQAIIWVKGHPVLTRKDFMGNHEWCFYGWKKGAGHSFYGPNNATDVWEVKKVNPQSMVHLTEKPVELATRAIEYSSKRGENVLDLFGGSGSTLIGAEQTGRHAFLMELDPLYCDVIVKRWEEFTGRHAERQPAGAAA